MFLRILPPLLNGVGTGADGFPPNKPPEVIVEIEPPNMPSPVADVVVVVLGVSTVEVAPKSVVPPGLESKMFLGAVVAVPGPVVPGPVVPVPVAGVEVCIVPV